MKTKKFDGLRNILINFSHLLSLSDNYVRFLESDDSILPTIWFSVSCPECLLSHIDFYISGSLRECEYPLFWICKLYRAR